MVELGISLKCLFKQKNLLDFYASAPPLDKNSPHPRRRALFVKKKIAV
jgi:hypothetical protein